MRLCNAKPHTVQKELQYVFKTFCPEHYKITVKVEYRKD